MTALHFASQNDHSQIIEILMQFGANSNVQNKVTIELYSYIYITMYVAICAWVCNYM